MTALIRLITGLVRLVTLTPLGWVGGIVWTLAVPAFRGLAGVLLMVAAVALASDAGPVTDTGSRSFTPTTVVAHWQQIEPASLESTRVFFTKRARPWVWEAFSAPLRLPTFVFFAGLGLVFGYLGRHRRQVNIFVN